ncbi:unnamed protein product, partial [Dovyalis caffra]
MADGFSADGGIEVAYSGCWESTNSLADNGNNNFLSTSAKANYPPYGIDFPSGPTGRFCNGRTTTDII